jgi:UDP-N-acetylmuramoylalanine--D-glutamate ligase
VNASKHPAVDLSKQTLAVVGLGHSGIAAARLARRLGARVLGFDARERSALPASLEDEGIELRLGPHALQDFAGVELVVVSPGVPPLGVLDELEQRGVNGSAPVEVIGEFEFATRMLGPESIVIGGTNGKSTTTTLVARMLEGQKTPHGTAKVFAGANLGEPTALAVGGDWDFIVFEVSSFQLERAPRFRPRVSVLLNVTEDHLDRYPNFAAYAHAKGNAFVNQTPEDVAVVPAGDALCLEQASRGRGRIVTFGEGGDYTVQGDRLVEAASGEGIALGGVALYGKHNWANLAAAVAAVRAVGADWASLERGLQRFVPLGHRMHRVAQRAGVTYYDDSKGTNVGASVTAVLGLVEPRCVLIAGGRDKHGSYAPLVDALAQKGRALVVLGEAAERIATAAQGVLPVLRARDMQDAVQLAAARAQSGDAVLLSPACSSFDMFSGYAERGDVFARAVHALS